MVRQDHQAVGLVEIQGLTPAIVAMDQLTKHADVGIDHYELNDLLGVCIKIVGAADVQAALEAAESCIESLHGRCVTRLLLNVAASARSVVFSSPDYQPLIDQPVVFFPVSPSQQPSNRETSTMSSTTSFALGMIETQGFSAVLSAIDTACKAANVEVIGKEKLGGGYIAVLIKGDVAAVEAAVAADRQEVNELGKLIAAHVIASPSSNVLALLPQLSK